MKSLAFALVLCCSLMFVRAAPAASAQTDNEREDQFLRECNATTPVQRNPRFVIASGIATGELFTLSHNEQCVLYCVIEKLKIINKEGNIRNGSSVINYMLKKSPELAKYTDVLVALMFQINRSSKGFTDKCVKAQIVYHRLAEVIFSLAVADAVQEFTGVKDQVVNAVENGHAVDPDLSAQVREFLTIFDTLISSLATSEAGSQQSQQTKIVT